MVDKFFEFALNIIEQQGLTGVVIVVLGYVYLVKPWLAKKNGILKPVGNPGNPGNNCEARLQVVEAKCEMIESIDKKVDNIALDVEFIKGKLSKK